MSGASEMSPVMLQITEVEYAYKPKVGEECLYKERGGVNWCACQIIAEYGGLLWIHNFYTGAHPVKRIAAVEFKPMPRGLLGVAL